MRRRALATAWPHAHRVFVVGPPEAVGALTRPAPEFFVAASTDAVPPEIALGPIELVVLSLEEPWFDRAAVLGRQLALDRLFVLLGNVPTEHVPRTSCSALAEARPRLRELGFVTIECHRLFWPPDECPAGPANPSRTARLDRETREVLIECRRADDPVTVGVLEDRIVMLQRQLDLLSDIQVQQARTRDAETRRLARLEELEATVQRLEHLRTAQTRVAVLAESEEIRRLHGEIDLMKSTSVWRFGERYWALRRWVGRLTGGQGP
jgi:hypothetical protein